MNIARDIRVEIADWKRDQASLRAIREAVFVFEQHVPSALEWDGIDFSCTHVLAYVNGNKPVGTGRLLPDGHIGRMAVLRSWRGLGIGSRLLQKLIEIAAAMDMKDIVLNAQTHAVRFYERHGFVAEGSEFDDAGIAHRRMVLRR